ncbi:MAG: YicC family protein [Lysobacterales bacterium]
MTAYGSAEGPTVLGHLRLEVRTVNHRFLEISTKLPEDLRPLEPVMRERIGARLSRGKLDLSARLRSDPERPAALTINHALLDQLAHLVDELTRRNGRLQAGFASDLLNWPGLVTSGEIDNEELARQVAAIVERALDALEAQREREGGRLAEIMLERVGALRGLRAAAIELLPAIRQALRGKLNAKLAEIAASVDPQRIEQEIVFALSRMDVDEELDRLGVHLDEIARTLGRREPVGRRLDFLIQELHREANTFGSKSTDARTSQLGVDMKVLIEQLREQVQNLE